MGGSIAAIVPTFNRAHFLRESLRALLAQTRPLAEIIVWDDGSTDGTAETVAALEGPIRYFRQDNAGKSRALNAAMDHVSADYIWICDDDDLSRPDAAERLAAALDRADAGVAAGSYLQFWLDETTGARTEAPPGYWPDLSSGSVLRHLLEDIFLFQNATMVRRDAYALVGPFREDLPRSIDYDMILRLAARYPVALIDGVLFEQRKHSGARGPLNARHAADQSETVWLQTDQAVLAGLRPLLPLSLYEAMFDTDEPALAARAALMQRAGVYARRDDWAPALEDFSAAAEIDAGPMTPLEWRICRRAMEGKHGVGAGMQSARRRQAGALRSAGPVGRDIAAALARGIRWRARRALQKRDLPGAASVLRYALATGGLPPGAPPAAGHDRIAERDRLPTEAYRW
ncbi:MAG: glycosyltransferase family 2 protein [Pseudomonadota bacterium]